MLVFRDYSETISSEWVNWQDFNKKNAFQCAAENQNDYLVLLEFILNKNPNYIKQLKTDYNLLFQVVDQNNFKIAKPITELYFCELLGINRKQLQPNDNNHLLGLCAQLIKIVLDIINYIEFEDLHKHIPINSMIASLYHIANICEAKKMTKYLISIGKNFKFKNTCNRPVLTVDQEIEFNLAKLNNNKNKIFI